MQVTKDGSLRTGWTQTGMIPNGVMVPPRFSTEKVAKERVKARESRERKETTKVAKARAKARAKAKARKEKARMARETMPPILLLKPHRTMKAGR